MAQERKPKAPEGVYRYSFHETVFIEQGVEGRDYDTILILFSNGHLLSHIFQHKINIISIDMKQRPEGSWYPVVMFEIKEELNFFEESIPSLVQVDMFIDALEVAVDYVDVFEEATFQAFGREVGELQLPVIHTMFSLFVIYIISNSENEDFDDIKVSDIVSYFKEVKSKILGG